MSQRGVPIRQPHDSSEIANQVHEVQRQFKMEATANFHAPNDADACSLCDKSDCIKVNF